MMSYVLRSSYQRGSNMQTKIILLTLPFVLTACSSVELNTYDETQDQYLKHRNDTANMSEYDKQRYYDEHQLGPMKPVYNPKNR